MPIRYREIPSQPGYFVGINGTVFSTYGGKWRQLSMHRRPYGARYVMVCLREGGKGKVVCCYVHRLVLEAFRGPCPEGLEALHGDGNTSNNHLQNLRWGTRLENREDSRRHGTLGRSRPRVSPSEVREIRKLRSQGVTMQSLVQMFGRTIQCIRWIIKKRSHAHVPD